jgi:preprotein translocase subunit YajC
MEGGTAIFAPEKPRHCRAAPWRSGPSMQDILTNPLFMFVPIGLIFYFLVMRPQQQQQKEHRLAIENLRRGDTVVTAGGLVGRITKAPTKEDAEVTVEIADNVQVKVVKSTLSQVRAKSQPVAAKSDKS